jgi:hypothetical protein
MPSLTCPACNAVLNASAPVPEGKSVKCPKCGASFTAGGSVPAKAEPEPPKNKSKVILIGAVAGGLLLVTCCCTGVGLGGWWFFSSKGIKSAIVGTWYTSYLEYEFRSDGKMKLRNLTNGSQLDLAYKFVESNVIEIKGDTSGNNTLNGQPYPPRRMQVTLTGDELTLRELSPDPDPEGVKFKRR